MSGRAGKRALVGVGVLLALRGTAVAGLDSELLSLDPSKRIGQYVYDVWRMEDGLPSNHVEDVLQTRDGYLWVATAAGLARFDGQRFTVFDMAGTAAFTTDRVNALAESPDGSLWLGFGSGGLARYRDGRFERLALAPADPASRDIHDLLCDRRGTIWAGTQGGLLRVDEPPESVAALAGVAVRSLLEGPDGGLWVGTAGRGLYRVVDGRVEAVPLPAELAEDVLLALAATPDGTLWIGAERLGLARLENGEVTVRAVDEGRIEPPVAELLVDRAGALWIGTHGGLARFYEESFEAFTEDDGMVDDRVRALFEDREGHLWIGSYSGGLQRLKDGFITVFGPADGLAYPEVRAVFEDRRGRFWIGSHRGLSSFEDGRFTSYAEADGLPPGIVYSIAQSADDTVWIGGDAGLARLVDGDRRRFRLQTAADGLVGAPVRVVLPDPGDSATLWLGTIGGGLQRVRGGRPAEVFTAADGLSGDDVRWIQPASAAAGDLWLGTYQGLNRFRDGSFTVYTDADGLSGNALVSAYQDGEGNLWIGTLGGGLTRLRDGAFSAFTTRDGLLSNDVWWILEDGARELWLSNDQGIYRLSKADLEAYAAGRLGSLTSDSFGLDHGLKDVECNGGGYPAGFRRSDGTLWFPTMAGVARVDTTRRRSQILPPPVVIESLAADGVEVALGPEPLLPAGEGNLEIRYTALSFRDPEAVRFRYRLERYDRDWVDAGGRRAAFYTRLPPGRYNFRVRAETAGVESPREAVLTFRLAPHVYQTPWFRVLAAAGLAMAAYGGYRLRTRTIHRRTALLRREIRRRQDAEADLKARNVELRRHQAELEQLVAALSHEFKTPLVTIKGYVGRMERDLESGDADRLRHDLERISTAADDIRELLAALRELTAFRKPESPEPVAVAEVARSVVAAARERFAESGATVRVDDDLPVVRVEPGHLRYLFEILFDNALRFAGEKPPRIEIRRRESVTCCVRDFGLGIDAPYLESVFHLFEKLDARTPGAGVGLAIARRIVELYGGQIWVESPGPGLGTTVCFVLPEAGP